MMTSAAHAAATTCPRPLQTFVMVQVEAHTPGPEHKGNTSMRALRAMPSYGFYECSRIISQSPMSLICSRYIQLHQVLWSGLGLYEARLQLLQQSRA
jgi:hypothetical protein